MASSAPAVLLIDDELSICTGVSGLLEMEGFNAEYVLSAQEGLNYLETKALPDIVLLDVNLGQGMDGVEVLKTIKEKHKYVQVIMFTSQDNLGIGLQCMKNGAIDYMTKPFDLNIFLKIAATAIERKRIEQIRDLYFEMVIHDLKNPLQVIGGACEMLSDTLKDGCTPIQKRLLEAAENGVKQIHMIIGNILGITSFEKKSIIARKQSFQLKETIIDSFKSFDSLDIFFPEQALTITTDRDLFLRVLTNIISNAYRFATPGSKIAVSFQLLESCKLIASVTNSGSYIPIEMRDVVFDKFLSVHSLSKDAKGQNFGLGLTFSKMAVETLGGKIWIEGDESIPSTTFKVSVPTY